MCLPGDKSLLSLPLGIVSLLFVVVLVPVLPHLVPLVGPAAAVVVVVVTVPGPGPGAAPVWTTDADPSDVPCLSEPTVPLLSFPLSVAGFRQLRAEAVRGEAPVPAVAAAAAPGSWPPGPGAASRAAAV